MVVLFFVIDNEKQASFYPPINANERKKSK